MRQWNEFVAILADQTWGGVFGLAVALLLVATVVAVLWYTWPPRFLAGRGRGSRGGRGGRRVSRRRFRWSSLRWRWQWPKWLRWRRKRRQAPRDLDELAPDELPDLPAEVLALTADQLAAAGRYAEAVRERLRAIVRELVDGQVIEHHPGWTVTELAATAAAQRPATAAPLRAAADTFSSIWYGMRTATAGDDLAMREYAASVHSELLTRAAA